jgi:hypothetical protein
MINGLKIECPMKISKKYKDDGGYRKRTPLWKWVLILLLVVAMPLYFSYYRMTNLRYILKNTAPTSQQPQNSPPPVPAPL